MTLNSSNSIKSQLIDKLKYIFTESGDLHFLANLDESPTPVEPSTVEPSPVEINESLDEDDKLNKLYNMFKKIKIVFITLADLFKFLILQVDDERYQKIEYEKIKFPKTIDELILIIGCYGDAFTIEMQEELLNILDNVSFKDLYTISEIPNNMIPFVADDNINLKLLSADYLKFSNDVKNIACNILNINTDFDDTSLIDCV